MEERKWGAGRMDGLTKHLCSPPVAHNFILCDTGRKELAEVRKGLLLMGDGISSKPSIAGASEITGGYEGAAVSKASQRSEDRSDNSVYVYICVHVYHAVCMPCLYMCDYACLYACVCLHV